jgi:hypothetical protein
MSPMTAALAHSLAIRPALHKTSRKTRKKRGSQVAVADLSMV